LLDLVSIGGYIFFVSRIDFVVGMLYFSSYFISWCRHYHLRNERIIMLLSGLLDKAVNLTRKASTE